MSTIPEVIVARHCGIHIFAFSLITNECITEYDSPKQPINDEVVDTANTRQNQLKLLVTRMVSAVSSDITSHSTAT